MTATRPRADLAQQFVPYDERMQPTPKIVGYKETQIRSPNQPLLKRPVTLSEITGPLDLASKLSVGTNDLSRAKHAKRERPRGHARPIARIRSQL